jgi:glycosyltransferase involved in cell wall biosynthesis
MKKVKNIIFTPEKLNIRSGGPSGYIANLQEALKINNAPEEIAIVSMTAKLKKQEKRLKLLTSLITLPILCKKARQNAKAKLRSLLLEGCFEDGKLPKIFKKELDMYDFESITCHSSICIKALRQYIDERGLKANLIIMSHSPESVGSEIYSNMIEKGATEEVALKEKARWEEMEQEGFKLADTIMFPSEEAMEPYFQTIDNFAQLIEGKKMVFIATGCQPLATSMTNEDILAKYNIPNDDKINICYIGRHTQVKGYDLLLEAAKKALKENDNIRFIIGGKPSNIIKPLEDENWLELGFINPAEVLKVSDVFILPNKRTYFDLILLEVLSTNTPVFASNTGGNKSVYNQTDKAITVYDNIDQLVELISNIKGKTNKAEDTKIVDAYNKIYSLEPFGKRYIDLVNKSL